ncbi:MAG: putative PEP-binding protein [Cyanobacteria bacterium P01_A01_bin.45]
MEQIYWLDKIEIKDRAQIGRKAFQLSEIMQRGYPVIPGIIISTEIFDEFLETLNNSDTLVTDLPDSSLHLNANNWRQLQLVASNLRREILDAVVPEKWINSILESVALWQEEYLIFRPSILLPNAVNNEINNPSGLLDFQIGKSDTQGITSALKLTWSQFYRARSLFYWQQAGINLQQVKLAVLVQPIKNAIASGSLQSFSWGWEIKSTWGLGIAISVGEVIPDIYYVDRETGTLREQKLGSKILEYRLPDVNLADHSVFKPNSVALLDSHSCLVSQILKENQQQQFALSSNSLQQINQLTQRLINDLGTNFKLQWTIPAEENILITKVDTTNLNCEHSQKLMGLAAAAGTVNAQAYIISDINIRPVGIPRGVIVVASEITPDWLPLLRNASGIITQRGGFTSHGAILAREVRIPAIVNVSHATSVIENGEQLYIDGNKGEIYRLDKGGWENFRNNAKIRGIEELQNHQVLSDTGFSIDRYDDYLSNLHITATEESENLSQLSKLNSFEKLIATKLLVNLSQPNLIEQLNNIPTDGIGLLRSELMALNILEGKSPQAWLQSESIDNLKERWYEQIMNFVSAFAPKPVFYRSLDWRSHEMSSLRDSEHISTDSILGERGTLSYMRHPEIFEFELEVLKAIQDSGYSNIHLILPFVRTVEEFTFCRQQVEKIGLKRVHQFQLWIMAEVPSVLFLLPEYVKAGVEGISIGTNDLTQLLLGIDREKGHLATIFDERHPAVMGAISQLITQAKELGIPCSICGQAPARYPEIIDKLVEWGITSISVETDALEQTRNAIARAEKRIILSAARDRIIARDGDRID